MLTYAWKNNSSTHMLCICFPPKTGCDTWGRHRPHSRETRRGLGGWRTLPMAWASLPRSRLHSTMVEPRRRLASDDPSANTRKLKCKRHWHIYLGSFCTQDRRQSSSIYTMVSSAVWSSSGAGCGPAADQHLPEADQHGHLSLWRSVQSSRCRLGS